MSEPTSEGLYDHGRVRRAVSDVCAAVDGCTRIEAYVAVRAVMLSMKAVLWGGRDALEGRPGDPATEAPE